LVSRATGISGAFASKNKEISVRHAIGMDLLRSRIGLIALEKGFIKADQLYEALMRQRAQETGGAERRPLGMLLKDQGSLPVTQIDDILQALKDEAESEENTPMLLK